MTKFDNPIYQVEVSITRIWQKKKKFLHETSKLSFKMSTNEITEFTFISEIKVLRNKIKLYNYNIPTKCKFIKHL